MTSTDDTLFGSSGRHPVDEPTHGGNGHATAPDDDGDALAPGTVRFMEDPLHYGIEHGPWPDDVPHGQNDMHWRYEDDPKGARRAEMRIAACWSLMLIGGLGLAICYATGGQAQIEGACLGIGFAGLGAGLVLWARDLLPGHDVIGSRGGLTHASSEEDRRRMVQSLGRGLEPMARRPFLFKFLGAVGGVFGVALLFPLASLGPRVNGQLGRTSWYPGARAVTEDGQPVKPSDILVNGVATVFPANTGNPSSPANAQDSTILINLGPASSGFEIGKGRQDWYVGALGSNTCIVAFSKICTHAGCPVSLYDVQSHQLVCPCHQSTFDVLQDCKPVFGPAPRNLPQLPLSVDAEGYIIARHDYYEPVGPGYWNRPSAVKQP
jgi:ubiquinol-cytochrome c reductase iron-sulfur subunit